MWPSERVERVNKLPVVGACILFMNTDKPDCRSGWTGKIIGETRHGDVHLFSVRWFNGLVDHEVEPQHCAHV